MNPLPSDSDTLALAGVVVGGRDRFRTSTSHLRNSRIDLHRISKFLRGERVFDGSRQLCQMIDEVRQRLLLPIQEEGRVLAAPV